MIEEAFTSITLVSLIDATSPPAVSLAPHFLVWVVSKAARFLKGRFVCANWDVDELVAKKKDIETSRILEGNVHGWPYGKGMDAMLAQAEGEK